MHIHDTLQSGRSRQSPASNFLAARIGAFTTLLCYAKFAPAALQCGETDDQRREDPEAAARRAEFEVSDFAQANRSLSATVRKRAPMAPA
jgi:hypothetical protein